MESSDDLSTFIKILSGAPIASLDPDFLFELVQKGAISMLEQSGSSQAVQALLSTALDLEGRSGVRANALLAIQRLAEAGNENAIDAAYHLAVEADLSAARQWIETHGWRPTRLALRILFDWFTPGSLFTTKDELSLLAQACQQDASPALRAHILASAPARNMENWALIVAATLPDGDHLIDQLVTKYPLFSEAERALTLERLDHLAQQSGKDSLAGQAIADIFVAHEDIRARQIAALGGYHPQDPLQQALFLFLAENWPAYNTLDFDHSLLINAYETGNRALKRRILEHARQTGQMDWLRDISSSGRVRWPGDLTDADWEIAIQRLSRAGQKIELWRLVQVAPPIWCAQILEELTLAGWLPEAVDERPFFAALQTLSRECRSTPLVLHPRMTITAPHGGLNCLSIRPDNKEIAAGSSEQPIYLWSLPEGRLRYPPINGPAPVVRALVFSPDGSLLAAATGDHRVRIYRLQDGAILKTLEGHRALIRSLAMHPDGRLLASAGFDGTIRLWRFPHGAPLKTIQPQASKTGAEIFALVTGAANTETDAGATCLISAGADRLVSVWSLPDGTLLRQMAGHEDTITNLSTSPGSDLVASAGRDGIVRVWNYTSGGLVRLLEGSGAPLTALCLHPTDQVLLGAVARPGQVTPGSPPVELVVWNLSTGRIIARHAPAGLTKPGHAQAVTALAISPDGDDLYSCDSSGRLIAWDLRAFLTARLSGDAGRPGSADDLANRLRNPNLHPAERKWLAFSAELAHFRQRFDIELTEIETIPVGEFDIEL